MGHIGIEEEMDFRWIESAVTAGEYQSQVAD